MRMILCLLITCFAGALSAQELSAPKPKAKQKPSYVVADFDRLPAFSVDQVIEGLTPSERKILWLSTYGGGALIDSRDVLHSAVYRTRKENTRENLAGAFDLGFSNKTFNEAAKDAADKFNHYTDEESI